MKGRYVGVDVGGTNVRVAVWEGEATPVLVAATALPPDLGSLVELVASAVDGPVTEAAVGLPGRVTDGEAVWVPNVRYLEGRGLPGELGSRLGAPVRLANDGHMALLGESRFGSAREERDAILVTVGTGIGGAVMCRGRLVRGANGTAGSFGWLSMGEPLMSEAGGAPQVGPWERAASGLQLERRASALPDPVDAHRLLDAAAGGDAGAATIIERFVTEFGAGLASLSSLFDPEVVVVSGGVADLVGKLLPRLRQVFEASASPSVRGTPIRTAHLREAAGAFGAAVYAREGDEVYLS